MHAPLFRADSAIPFGSWGVAEGSIGTVLLSEGEETPGGPSSWLSAATTGQLEAIVAVL